MKRSTAILGTSLLLAFAVACENQAHREQEKANHAQNEANEKIAAAERESTTKITSAQAEADKKIAEATANFAKLREDYRHKSQKDLDDVNLRIAKLETKAKTATGKSKAEIDTNLTDIHTKRDAFRANFATLEEATATTWDAKKQSVEKSWDDLKDAVDRASP